MRQIVRYFAILILVCSGAAASTDLFSYVAKEDPSYKWEKLQVSDLPFEMQKYNIKLTSQTWKDIPWEHMIMIVKPKDVKDSTLIFMIIVGSWGKDDSEETNIAVNIANGTKAPVAILYDVPYQPLFDGLREDRLIAYTFNKVLETGDNEWALLLPMAKSAVRAMDAIQDFMQKELNIKTRGFVVAGASKRGWTTWLSAVVDDRVKGICPIVYDNLNLVDQMEHQLETWGKYSEQIDDYTRLNIPQQVKTEKGRKLAALVDPFTYRGRITVPKLIVVGSNDRYWPLDAMNLYFDDLIGEKYILRVPNKGHDVGDMQRVLSNAVAFFKKINNELSFPNISWKFYETDDGIEMVIDPGSEPTNVSAWVAESDTKDFRDSTWKEVKLSPGKSGYSFSLAKPQKGYSALFGEVLYTYEGDKQLYLSTAVRIIGAK